MHIGFIKSISYRISLSTGLTKWIPVIPARKSLCLDKSVNRAYIVCGLEIKYIKSLGEHLLRLNFSKVLTLIT